MISINFFLFKLSGGVFEISCVFWVNIEVEEVTVALKYYEMFLVVDHLCLKY